MKTLEIIVGIIIVILGILAWGANTPIWQDIVVIIAGIIVVIAGFMPSK